MNSADAISLSSFIFHRNFSSPFCTASLVSLASVLTQDARCASPWLVVHSPPPRPCASTMPAPQAVARTTAPMSLFDPGFMWSLPARYRALVDGPVPSTPKQYNMPSYVPMYTRPLATDNPLK